MLSLNIKNHFDTATGGDYRRNRNYDNLAGEIEARNVSLRRNMTDEQRRQSPAAATEEIPRNQQVVFFDESGNPNEYLSARRESIEAARKEGESYADWANRTMFARSRILRPSA